MANGLYQAEGIILNSYDSGEVDKVLTVFTQEFGMLKFLARGTRKHTSKLNKFLNIFSYGRFGFVSGRGTWHLVDAQDIGHFDEILNEEEKIHTFGRVSNFVQRFCHGEEKNEKLWAALLFFIKSGDELVFYARALASLGYLDEKEIESSSRENLAEIIKEGIASSQL
ncbi:DNA repair protein RecO [Candidatus Giovannonibacteria bacterium]|nr:DNA repair protein RecO [Candidatus Giovannonibacteria bacterium]